MAINGKGKRDEKIVSAIYWVRSEISALTCLDVPWKSWDILACSCHSRSAFVDDRAHQRLSQVPLQMQSSSALDSNIPTQNVQSSLVLILWTFSCWSRWHSRDPPRWRIRPIARLSVSSWKAIWSCSVSPVDRTLAHSHDRQIQFQTQSCWWYCCSSMWTTMIPDRSNRLRGFQDLYSKTVEMKLRIYFLLFNEILSTLADFRRFFTHIHSLQDILISLRLVDLLMVQFHWDFNTKQHELCGINQLFLISNWQQKILAPKRTSTLVYFGLLLIFAVWSP